MKIIGLNVGELNSSAALCVNSEIIAGAPEERYIRDKKTKLFSNNALDYCLAEANCNLEDIDAIAQAWNPGSMWVKFNPLISSSLIKREEYFYSVPDNLYNWINRNESPNFVMQKIDGKMPNIYFIKHHLCHASNAFFLSNFDEAAFLTADWKGEMECITKGIAKNNKIDILDTQWMPDSIGMFYATFTEILGYKPDNDEWKVMAMSAENIDCSIYQEKILSTIKLLKNGKFTLDQDFYTGSLSEQPNLFSEKLLHLIDCSSSDLNNKNKNYDWQCKVAKAMQLVAEKIIWHILDDLYKKTKMKNLVVSGGFFMNSVLNGKILGNSKFENLYISYSPDDAGNSIGAALYVNHCILDQPRKKYSSVSNIGPKYKSSDIENTLKRRNIKFEKIENPEQKVAKILSLGEVVAIFQGRMEFGDRALGFRSILGDPRKIETKDKINSMIKYRESYRPFAPSTLVDKVNVIFEVEKGFQCNYMEKVVKVRKEWQKKIPAVTHFDGSGRLQTVQKNHNAYFYKIIEEFEKISNIPVVLNTSFNINGEPIVLTPDDALNTFFNSGLEFLMLENYLVQKIF